MERELSAGVTARLGDRVVYPALFFEGTFWSVAGGVEQLLNVWSGYGSFTWDSKTWLGQGNLLGFRGVEEAADVRAIGFTITLAGQKTSNISLAKQGTRQGKPGTLWLGLLTQAGTLADEPVLLKRGKLDVAPIDDSGDDCRINVVYEGSLIDALRPRERRYTHEDQKIDYPSDGGFRYVQTIQDRELTWGKVA